VRGSPAELFSGSVLLAVPHMDDCVLACGGTLALLPDPTRVQVVYASDGRRSPAPLFPGRDAVPDDLFAVRAAEARAALGHLGVPAANLHFLGLPDACLERHEPMLAAALAERIETLRPDHVLAPFRYDCNRDHVSLAAVAKRECGRAAARPVLSEYFVYYRWRMLPGRDVRRYLRPELLWQVDIGAASARKREALDLFVSQTTRYYPWQTRPNLLPGLLDEVSAGPECFLRAPASLRGADVFTGARAWIRVAHRLEPVLKEAKDRAVALLRRGSGRRA
jgi:LmbE family N-acetylglucosaminyl deacetylase